MSSERELDEGIKSIKSAWRREHTARANLEKMLEQAESENAKLKELCADMYGWLVVNYEKSYVIPLNGLNDIERDMRELGIEVEP